VIGRGARAQVDLPDPEVSSTHALIAADGARLVLTDPGSMNGTQVAGQRVTQPIELQKGDLIHVGQTELMVRSRRAWEGRLAAGANVALVCLALVALMLLGATVIAWGVSL
jgi:pSer/pThr/pTyr-binding forkhead associated (FHA) protein